ncbi:MAG: cell division ATPase MinD [Candidatus Aenigmarchaeota archaeon]|nr:cell division ATPase MinD [Candidatus Aenigmarchaeota archaeon]
MEKTRVIGIVSGKGGVGKTTVVSNLGVALAKHFKKKVVIVDANITTSHLGLFLGIYYSPITLNKLLKTRKRKLKLKDLLNQPLENLIVVTSSLSVRDLKGVDILKLEKVIDKIKRTLKPDFILIDSAPGLGREALATLKAADEILFVSNPFIPAAMDIIRVNEVAKELKTNSIGIVLNMVRNEPYELTPEEIEQFVELPIIEMIPMDKNVLKALALKAPVVDKFPDSKASKAFIRLAGKFCGEQVEFEESIFDSIKNWFSKLFKK